ncbi:hypothetical protein THAOC_24730 [Thalassiosira oceanica]|uniref:Uncharacterized protein n=1 Tax=Thalassiosira oceanica TaxID=159749 RepID=K0RP28_THAOC|nr:hypothetical protein THAOC_24730 [Thalassiosira oceanica]|eukprot:EJK55533.1 hypothetical protein THAOC_24730 [Thalassiosira oceanica]
MDPTPRERDQFSKTPKPRECEATLECETTLNPRRVGSSCRRERQAGEKANTDKPNEPRAAPWNYWVAQTADDEVVFFTKYDKGWSLENVECRSRRELIITLYRFVMPQAEGELIQQRCPGEGNYKISIDTKVKPTSVRTTKPLPLFRVQTDPAERLNPLPTWHCVQRVSLWGGGLLQHSVPHTSSSHGSSWMAFLSAK